MDELPPISLPPPWFKIAMAEIGVREVKGNKHNPRIGQYHSATIGAGVKHLADETPWCSSFVNWCMTRCSYNGTRSKRARSWLEWGEELEQPRRGCIVVLSRGPAALGLGHVGFFDERLGDLVRLLGGNQGNRVSVAGYAADRILSYRWPVAADYRGLNK